MKRFKIIYPVALVLGLSLAIVGAPQVVGAENSVEVRTEDSSVTVTDDEAVVDSQGTATDTQSAADKANKAKARAAQERARFEAKAQELLEKQRAGKTDRSIAARQKACEVREKRLNIKIDNFGKHAQKHLRVFDRSFARIQEFQATKKLDAPNYSTLVAQATAAQAKATAAVNALDDVNVTIDCSATDPAAFVLTIKTGTEDTRAALKEYRTAIKNVISALQSVNSKANTNTTEEQ